MHSETAGVAQGALEAARVAAMRGSDATGAIDVCMRILEPSQLEAMLPALIGLLHRGTGLPTRAGTARLIVQLAPWLVLSGLVLMPVALWMIPGVGTADSCCFQTAFEARRAALMGLPFVGGLSYLPFVCRAIKPETGPLAKLGVGTKKVRASHVPRLQKWRNVLMIPTILCFLFSHSRCRLPISAECC